MKRIYLSPSNQEHNVGVAGYGTEEARMHGLARAVAKLLRARGFETRKSVETWSMEKVVADSNAWKADAHICIHTNAGGSSSQGTVAFYGSKTGKALTEAIYRHLAPVSPGNDHGVQAWPGLYEIAYTHAPCAYLEVLFHTSYREVKDYLTDSTKYANAIAKGICEFYGVPWDIKPEPKPIPVTDKVVKVPVPVKKPTWWSKLTAYMKRKKTPAK